MGNIYIYVKKIITNNPIIKQEGGYISKYFQVP